MAVKTHALFYKRDDGEGTNICVQIVHFFDGCYASVLPLQHFTFVLKQIVLTNMKRMLNRMLRSIRFAANAENIRTKGHKNKRNYVRVSRLARKT